jgi:hypothetical protein
LSSIVERLLVGALIAVTAAAAAAIPRVLVAPNAGPEPGFSSAGVSSSPGVSAPPTVVHVVYPARPRSKAPSRARSAARRPVERVVIRKTTVRSVPVVRTIRPVATPRPHVQRRSHFQRQSRHRIRVLASNLGPGETSCDGTFSGTGKDVSVPSGATCILTRGTTVTHDLAVEPGGTLIASGVTVGHDLRASNPAGIAISGDRVGHDLRINGIRGSATGGRNYVSGTIVGHDMAVQGGLFSASPFAVGRNSVGHDLVVTGNQNTVTVAGNSVGHDARLQR